MYAGWGLRKKASAEARKPFWPLNRIFKRPAALPPAGIGRGSGNPLPATRGPLRLVRRAPAPCRCQPPAADHPHTCEPIAPPAPNLPHAAAVIHAACPTPAPAGEPTPPAQDGADNAPPPPVAASPQHRTAPAPTSTPAPPSRRKCVAGLARPAPKRDRPTPADAVAGYGAGRR